MKRIWKRALPLLLTLWLLAGNAWAAENASMAACFRQEDQFYGYAVLDHWPAAMDGELRSAGLSLPLQMGPVRLADSGLPVTCLLLVDRSGSMQYVDGWVTRFITALEESADARFLLATFGDSFALEWDSRTGEDTAAIAADRIAYEDQKTDLSQGILDAAGYLKNVRREPGELLNLVVITDGIPDKSEGSPALSEVARQLEEDSTILVHTFGLRTDEPGSQEALETLGTLGQGAHLVSSENVSAQALGEELAGFVNDLCVVGFPWNAQNTGDTELVFSWEDEGEQVMPLAMGDIPVIAVPEGKGSGDDPTAPIPPEAPEQTAGTEIPDDPKEPEGASDDPEAVNDQPQTDDAEGITDENDTDGKPVGWLVWAIVGVVALVLLAVLLFLLFRKRKKGAEAPPKGGIYMRVEVIAGTYDGPEELYLTDELIIGRAGRCDIRWKNKEVAPRNSRVFLRDNMICIEDLASPQGTALGGMRLHSPNRLRSGDEISIGPVRFRLKF